MTFALGAKSLGNLKGVHPKLVALVKEAILHTTQDFMVHDGTRTVAEQRENVRKGVSKTMNSKHIIEADGYGHAVDLVPVVNGQPVWDWPRIYAIAEAMERAADGHQVELIWGGVWDKLMGTYGSTAIAFKAENQAYVQRRKKAGKSAFIDGPHFELV